MDVEGSPSGECLVGSDLVEELPVGLGLDAELVAVVDLDPVEVLVLQRAERSFADAVLAGALRPGTDVDQFGVLVDEAGEAPGLEAAAVVGHDRYRAYLARLGVGQMLEQGTAEQSLGLGQGDVDGRDRVVLVLGR